MYRLRCTAHSSFCSSRIAPIRRTIAPSLGKMPTTSVRRLISPSDWSSAAGPMRRRERHVGELGRLWPQLVRHLAPLAAGGLGVVLGESGGDEGRDDAPPTRQRCQLDVSTFDTAALMPSWTSEMTSLTPRSPRRRSLRRKSVQKVSASEGPMSIGRQKDARQNRRAMAKHFAPAIGVGADRDDHRRRDDAAIVADFDVGGINPVLGASRSRRRAFRVAALERDARRRPQPPVRAVSAWLSRRGLQNRGDAKAARLEHGLTVAFARPRCGAAKSATTRRKDVQQ